MELYFLEKTFSVPDDITTYWEAIRIAESQSEALFHSFCDTLASSTESYLSDEKLYDYMKDCAGIFIKRLCEKGIYNKTTDDYVFNNPAFDDYKQINQLAKNTIEALELQSNANISDQSKIAEENAASNITGSGVRVFTSSFLELAMGAAYESHQLNKQQAEAQQEYNNEVAKIIKRNTAILNSKVSDFIRNNYIPLMEKTLKIYVYNMADKYLEDLSHNNKFNKDTLKFTNISKSSSLLENLKYTDNKSAVLEEAFLACPFNIDVYFEAYKYANINKQTIETIKTMRLYYKFYNALFDKLKSIDVKKSLINALTDAEPLINILSLCDDTDKSTYYLTLIRPYVNDYARLKNFWSVSIESCKTSFTDFFEFPNTLTEEIIKEFAENQVKSIISQSDFDLLAFKPEIKFIERIAPDHFTEELTKDNIDKYYIEKIYGNLLLVWKEKIEEYHKKEEEKKHIAEEKRIAAEKIKKKTKHIIAIITSAAAVIVAFVIVLVTVIIPANLYNKAMQLYDNKELLQAASAFGKIFGYKDSTEKIYECLYKCNVNKTIYVGYDHTVGLISDGTVIAVGDNEYNQCNTSNWKDIIAISAGGINTVGLKSDGTVVTIEDDYEQSEILKWKDIIAISTRSSHTIGLKSNGTVIAVGDDGIYGFLNVSDWKDIVAIFASDYNTVGLKSNGTVVAVGDNGCGQCNVSNWKDIIAISAGLSHTVGLKSDGTVVAVGNNEDGRCNVSDWKDIVAISAGSYHTVGLKSDGTVVAVGNNEDGQCNVSDWKDIIAISAGGFHTVGLKSDGTVVAVGNNEDGQCNVSDWKDIKLPK